MSRSPLALVATVLAAVPPTLAVAIPAHAATAPPLDKPALVRPAAVPVTASPPMGWNS